MTPITSDEQALAVLRECSEICKDEGLHWTAEQIDSALACLRTRLAKTGPAVDGWLPIETAPKDGTVMVYLPEERQKMQVARFHPNVKTIGHAFAFDLTAPTHWRPLPEPPTAALEARG